MRHFLLLALACLWLAFNVNGQAKQGFSAVGTIKKVDAEKNILSIFANGQDRNVPIAKEAKILDKEGKPLKDGLKSKELAEGTEVTVQVERGENGPIIAEIRLGKQAGVVAKEGKTTYGLKPLTEMSATDKYKGEDGGLYGGGKNDPPEAHFAAAKKESAKIVPLDADGKPSDKGTIALVSISMSNATQEYSMFKQIADRDDKKSTKVTIVDCAQGGQAMAQWVDPKARAWTEAERRLEAAKISPKQVQVIWVKLANIAPRGELTEHGKKLQEDTLKVLQNAKARFPNVRIAYLGSRIYGGYSTGALNPEPYAYEGAFAARWLIQDQIKGNKELNYDADKGAVKSPLLLWGPYLWADGTTPRKEDELIWERSDVVGDGVHPSQSGRQKVAHMLLKFFKTDSLASSWFVQTK
jgi:lysophospholipase L1-like esterase